MCSLSLEGLAVVPYVDDIVGGNGFHGDAEHFGRLSVFQYSPLSENLSILPFSIMSVWSVTMSFSASSSRWSWCSGYQHHVRLRQCRVIGHLAVGSVDHLITEIEHQGSCPIKVMVSSPGGGLDYVFLKLCRQKRPHRTTGFPETGRPRD